MKKQILIMLVILMLFVSGCSRLFGGGRPALGAGGSTVFPGMDWVNTIFPPEVHKDGGGVIPGSSFVNQMAVYGVPPGIYPEYPNGGVIGKTFENPMAVYGDTIGVNPGSSYAEIISIPM